MMQDGVAQEFLDHLVEAEMVADREPCPLTGCKAGASCYGHTKHIEESEHGRRSGS